MISEFVRDSTRNAGSCLAEHYSSVSPGTGQTFQVVSTIISAAYRHVNHAYLRLAPARRHVS